MLKYKVIPRKNMLTDVVLFYGQIKPDVAVKLDELVENISQECTVTRHDVKAVLSALQEQMYKAIRSGRPVYLGDLGSFRPTISTQGVEDKEDFKSNNIRSINVRFRPSPEFRYQISKKNPFVSFQNVSPKPEEDPEDGE